MGDRSLMQHLLEEGCAAGSSTPLLFANADGSLNVTAAATPSILKHSPSPLPVPRDDRVGRAGRGGSVTLREAALQGRGRGVRVVQVGCGTRVVRFPGAHSAIADRKRQQQR